MTQHAPERTIDLQSYKVLESSEYQSANPDGSIDCPDNEETVLLEYEPASDETTTLIHAIGASDAADVKYRLRYAQNITFTMESPPGGVNDPFSFTEKLGAPLETDQTVQLTAINTSGSTKSLVARAHIEVA